MNTLPNVLPTGTVTFLFTDIEGSTQLAQQFPDAMPAALARHHAILREAIEANDGYLFQIVGDAFCAAFHTASDGVNAALVAQRALYVGAGLAPVPDGQPQGLPLRVRMGIHTGAATWRDDAYEGYLTLTRAQRVMSVAHGAQVLLSQTTYDLVRDRLPDGVALRDLSEHRLKGLANPEHLFQVVVPDLPSEFPPLDSRQTIANNLPLQLTSFIGREREMAEVKRLLTTTRLLSLTGVGGTGKTRLALQVAADILDLYQEGVWFVALAPLADPALLSQTIAAVFGLRDQGGRSLLDMLTDYLRGKELLLLLDNCEHLRDACAQLTDSLLRACPHLSVLVTSREALNLEGEQIYLVPSLEIPTPNSQLPISNLQQFDSVRLFIERATQAHTRFVLGDKNENTIAQICQRLDGIPLAIELAAARVRVLSMQQIAARLDDTLGLLTRGNAPSSRHQTMRAALDWSYELLTEPERVLFRRLAVFAGSWELDAAEQVFALNGDAPLRRAEVLDVLTNLVEQSLVLVAEHEETARYRLLEPVRQYAFGKLEEANETDTIRQRHLDFFLKLAEEAEPKLYGAQQIIWLDRLVAEHDNLRVALEWSLAVGKADLGFQLAVALHWFWQLRGFWNEGRTWLQRMLSANSHAPSARRAKALYGIAFLMQMQRDITQSATLAEESLTLSREAGDKRGIALALSLLADIAYYQDDYQQATTLGEESVALFREVGDGYYLSQTLGTLGYIAEGAGDYQRALILYEESLALRRELGDKDGTAYHLYLLGRLAQAQGDDAQAMIVLDESLTLFRAVRNTWGIAVALRQLGYLALHQGDYHRVKSLLQEGLVLFQKLGDKYGVATVLGVLLVRRNCLGQPRRFCKRLACR